MKKLLATLVLALAATVAVGDRPAGAHQYDDYSLWYCAWSRPSSSYTIVHSVPTYLDPTWVRYYCGAVVGTIAFQWQVWRHLPTETWQYAGPIEDCRHVQCHEPGT